MTEKCEWCEGTQVDPVFGGRCEWCDATGVKNGLAAAVSEAVTIGTGVVLVSAEGVTHVPLKDMLVNLKPFRLLPYGTQFRYQGTQDVWVRTGHNLVAEWPSRVSGRDGVPIQSLCSFCHLDGDEDGNTLDTPVEVVDSDTELAALREELAQSRILAADQGLNLKRVKREFDAMKGRATAAEQRNAELFALPEPEQLFEALAGALGEALDCTRVWSAWGVGTMSEDDFVQVADQPERLHELASACLDAIKALANPTPNKACAARIGGVDCQVPRTDDSLFCAQHRNADNRQPRAPLTNEGLAFMMQRDGEQQ